MFHYYTASDFLHEIRVKLTKCKSSVELLIDELDFVILADDLIELSRNDLIIELVIQGISNEKSHSRNSSNSFCCLSFIMS